MNKVHRFKSVEYISRSNIDQFQNLPDMNNRRTTFAAVGIDDTIFAVGGYTNYDNGTESRLRSVECLKIFENEWKYCSYMDENRSDHAVSVGNISTEKSFFVFGGTTDTEQYSNDMLKYNIKKNEWTKMAPMTKRRKNLRAVTMNGVIFICGGYTSNGATDFCEKYSINMNVFSNIRSMNIKRSYFGMVGYKDKIFVAGGYTEAPLSSAEVYDIRTDEWENIQSMNTRRHGLHLAFIRGRLLAIGGHTGFFTTQSTEWYNVKTNSWSSGPDIIRRSHFAIATVLI